MSSADRVGTAEHSLSDVRSLASKFADEVRARFDRRVKRLRMFGSAARGDWTEASDLDVLVLLSADDTSAADEISRLAFHMGVVERGILIRPLILTEVQFRHLLERERRLALDIERDGLEL